MGWKAGRESGVKKREGSWGREIEEKVGQRKEKKSWLESREWQKDWVIEQEEQRAMR